MSDRIAEIERRVLETVGEERMLPDGCTVVAGFSGGADSTMLVHFLLGYAREHAVSLIAAHVNHGLRGAESDADEAFAAAWCAERGVPLRILRTDVRKLAKQNSEGLEECGRNVRYSFFRSLCGENGRIATAHTLTDSVETMLLNLARGAGPRGLSGIPPVREGIVRPLIRITRGEVEEYCRHYGLSYVTDSTNRSDEYARNRVRHAVLPVLREVNPGFERAVLRTAALLRQDEAYFAGLAREELEKAADANGGYSVAVLQKEPQAVLSRMIPLAVRKVTSARLGSGHIAAVSALIRSGRGCVTVAGGIQCAADGNTLFVSPEKPRTEEWSVPLELPETRLPDGRLFCVRPISLETKNREKINNLLFNNRINYDTILITNSFVRNRRPGDFFCPARRGVTKPLKKLMNEQKIPPFLRGRTAVLECAGRIVWIEGIGVSREAEVSEGTPRAAEITIKEC